MKQIVAFDFDGTITNRDTLLEFIKFAKGNFLSWLFASSALVVGYEVSPLSQLEDQADDFLLFF
mgnify:CR=1 FL=1